MASVAEPARSARRRLYLDVFPGETRGVVTVEDRPERLLIQRVGDSFAAYGARYTGRVLAASARLGLARIEIGLGEPGALKLAPGQALSEGSAVEVAVTAEACGGKGPSLRLIRRAPAAGPALLQTAPTLRTTLQAFAPGAEIIEGEDARDAADEAQTQALARTFTFGAGVTLTIEPTRALVAVDVDFDASAHPTKAALQANLEAIRQAARLLRLKALGGLVAMDLVGFPQQKAALHAAALEAFAEDGPEVVIGPLSRFGVLELSKPRRFTPLHERLLTPDGRSSARTLAQDLARGLERQGRFDPGSRLVAICAPEVAEALRPLLTALGPRYAVQEEHGREPSRSDIRTA